MNSRSLLILFLTYLVSSVSSNLNLDWDPANPAFDPAIYEDALDSELCSQQLDYIRRRNNTSLRLTFLDAGMRIPRGLLQLNFLDMGNYDQCLGIYEETDDSVIEGKYCMIQGPVSQDLVQIANALNMNELDYEFMNEEKWNIDAFDTKLSRLRNGVDVPRSILEGSVPALRMAICVPKPCTTQEGMTGLLFNLTGLGFRYEDEFCRFNGDKPFAPADYVAIVILSLIGLLTVLSTGYDVWQLFILKKDAKETSAILRSFSVYTNTKRLTTFSKNPNNLQCVDGIRAISMFWIIVGHTFLLWPPSPNAIDIVEWLYSFRSLWITTAPFAVDTFFFLSGLLLLYTTVGKLTSKKLLKSLHFFYLHRILRMLPLLTVIVLLQASVFHRIADGPLWNTVASNVNYCRNYWWSTLLFVQNYVNTREMCINHSWYLAIDMHCYIVSPLVLYWVLSGDKKRAWIGLAAGLLAALVTGTTYSFVYQLPGWSIAADRGQNAGDYSIHYYFNSLTRASPFFVGMIFGYLLHIWRGRKLQMPKYLAAILWIVTFIVTAGLMYITHLMKDNDWDIRVIDDLMNSFGRSLWSLGVGWVVFACQNGYGGPINWFLSLDLWKITSRISYAMFLFHYQIQFLISGAARAPVIFNDIDVIYEFFAQAVIMYGVGFFMTLIIDSPFSILFKFLLGDGPKKPAKEVAEKE